MASWRAPAGGTEEVPLMQRMRHPLPAPSFAASTAWARAAYLPANHPLTREAERLRDILLLAMEALIVEQHGANSAVAAAFRAKARSRPIPIRVFSCAAGPVAGFTDGFNSIAICDTEAMPHSATIPHELAHVVLRHAVLRTQHPGLNKLPWQTVLTELEADRLAVLSMAHAGYDPCPAILGRLLASGTRVANWQLLQAELLVIAARDPAALTTLIASDGIGSGGLLWPNREKQALNFAQVRRCLGVHGDVCAGSVAQGTWL
ncbi:hypothetical protein D9Q98_002501 [Chlorella vulgaris]|uniref:Uncharacterized protein n=1 Tax=Chlorella vulgaris TaxID=3077 RepID=A0A9D4YZ58_CHLVU|nr:hypothetical protein D9Q98_002501 [Chlorella vulgaris]